MVIFENEYDNLLTMLCEEVEFWTLQGQAEEFIKKYENENGDDYLSAYTELESFCVNMVDKIARILGVT